MWSCPSMRPNSFTACSQHSIHFLPGMSSKAIHKARLTYLHFIWMLNISLGVQISFASKSSTTSFQPCAVANPCFSLSILTSTYSRGKSKSPFSTVLLFTSQNNTCASGDSHQVWLAIALAVGLGLMSADVKFATNFGCASFSDCWFVD